MTLKYQFIVLSFILFLGTLKAQTTVNGSFLHNGIVREFSYYVPAIYNGTEAFPVVFNLHGYTSNGTQQSFYANFKPIADTAGFIVVHPEGSFQPGSTTTQFWNVGFFASAVDDVDFLSKLIDTISANYLVDLTRVYSAGMSNGGYMSLELACESGRFAAVASVTGTMTNAMANSCNPSSPIPVMTIHGTQDPTVPYNGNSSSIAADSVVRFWTGQNGCSEPPTFASVPDIVSTDGATAEHYVYNTCQNGVTIEHFKVINGAHTWPGATIPIGTTCQDFNACKEIWRFFSQYSNPTADLTRQAMDGVVVSPNPFSDLLEIAHLPENVKSVSLFNYQGKSFFTAEKTTKISTNSLPSGMYILKIETSEGTYQKKVTKI
jgi:polyhydroxybutyrate depolymerase